MSYEVEIAPAAKRQIKKLPYDVQQKVVAKLEELANDKPLRVYAFLLSPPRSQMGTSKSLF